ncbi:hypothetical protein PFNF135_02403 [Plasmodium falciparum NF135/5.C10]|uniref:Surface antigen n=2 Tax=Plasmodium falciparum TaxID=5833 RepID=A0A024WSR9_PLAFA|nr:hypothetical protein PFNF135_02403 [Plasmodium falciparum NF135/5.C10]ETW49755.1 hypothetical protein PFMALIP_02289 [Plasmodium falciparum MaliPS096_E11]
MNIYYFKLLIFTFLINTLVLPHYGNYQNNHYNISLVPNNTQKKTKISRLLAQTQNHNPHYHNDPELKEIIDKLNKEAIKKYQNTHEPYEQLQEIVGKKGTKPADGQVVEPMSTIEKELLETYEEMFGDKNHNMLKSGMYTNDYGKSNENFPTCACTDTNNTDLTKTKGKDKYLKHLKHRCTRGICFCSVGSAFLTILGLAFAKASAATVFPQNMSTCSSVFTITNIFNSAVLESTLRAGSTLCATGAGDMAGTAVGYATAIFEPCGIAALVLLILTVVLIIIYIWLYRRRKKSWKHECKKHLCK